MLLMDKWMFCVYHNKQIEKKNEKKNYLIHSYILPYNLNFLIKLLLFSTRKVVCDDTVFYRWKGTDL